MLLGVSLEREKPLVGISLITPALLSCKLLLTSVVGNSQMTAQEVEWSSWFVGCIKIVKALRWSLFKKNQAESERLPPTQAALNQAILRAHYQLLVWNNNHVANPVLPSPEGYGWQDEDGKWVPVMTNLPPLQKQLYSLSDASAPSPVAQTTVVSVKKPDLSVLISVCALKIAKTSMLRVMMSMMKTKSNRKFHRSGQ